MSSKTNSTSTQEDAKAALIPKLRFPEFRGTEEWKPITIKEASTPVTERVGEKKLTPVSICRIPDDYIDEKRLPLFTARTVLRELIASMQTSRSFKS